MYVINIDDSSFTLVNNTDKDVDFFIHVFMFDQYGAFDALGDIITVEGDGHHTGRYRAYTIDGNGRMTITINHDDHGVCVDIMGSDDNLLATWRGGPFVAWNPRSLTDYERRNDEDGLLIRNGDDQEYDYPDYSRVVNRTEDIRCYSLSRNTFLVENNSTVDVQIGMNVYTTEDQYINGFIPFLTIVDGSDIYYSHGGRYLRSNGRVIIRCIRISSPREVRIYINDNHVSSWHNIPYHFADGGYYDSNSTNISEVDNSIIIHLYSYKPPTIFHGDGPQFGIELEYRGLNRSEASKAVLDVSDNGVYFKYDSSVDIEMVSHPRSLESHAEYNWSEILEIISDHELTVDKGCGLHIHCDPQNDKTKAGIALIVYNNQQILERFGRRTWNSYCKSKILQKDDDGQYIINTGDRYEAVNFMSKTVEFRFFMSTLDREVLIETITLCDHIISYAQEHSLEECAEYELGSNIVGEAPDPIACELLTSSCIINGNTMLISNDSTGDVSIMIRTFIIEDDTITESNWLVSNIDGGSIMYNDNDESYTISSGGWLSFTFKDNYRIRATVDPVNGSWHTVFEQHGSIHNLTTNILA